MENSLKTDDTLSKVKQQFKDAYEQSIDSRAESELHRDYYDGKQWTSSEKEALRKRKQPCITDNRIADKIQYLLGLERRARVDPKAFPRNPDNTEAAEAATDALRFVEEKNDFDRVRSNVFENMLIEGLGAAEVIWDEDLRQIVVKRIRWDRVYVDPRSQETDYSDKSFCGTVAWMDENRAISRWPEKAEMLRGMFTEMNRTAAGDTYDDKPGIWVDSKRRRIQVMEHYWWDGKWMRGVFCGAGWLEEAAESAYKDEYNRSECALVIQAAYRDRDGDPYGVVRRYKDIQDEINKRRSKSLHLLSSQRVIAEKGAVEDANKARVEVQKPDGYVEITPGMKFDIAPTGDLAQGQFNLLADAIQALSMTGPNVALQGNSGSISGRAKQVDQEGGVIQIGALFDQLRGFQRTVYRMIWNRIRQFWNEEKWVRVRDDEGDMKFVGLNVPVTAGESAVEELKKQGLPPEQMQAMIQQIAQDPMSREPVRKKNDVAELDVDILIEEAPDTVTIQQEQFEMLTNLASAGVVFPPEIYIEASGLRNKKSLVDKLKGGGVDPQQQQMQMQKQAEQEQMAKAMFEADLAGKQAKAAKDTADANAKQMDTALKVDAVTDPKIPMEAQNVAG